MWKSFLEKALVRGKEIHIFTVRLRGSGVGKGWEKQRGKEKFKKYLHGLGDRVK